MYNLDNIIPQKPPMRFIDKIADFEKNIVHCQATITDSHMFFCHDKKSIPHWVALEIMAQTAATYGKLKDNDIDGQPIVAFLLSARNYTTSVSQYAQNSVLDIYAECIILDNGTGVFNCMIKINNYETASVTINAHQPKNADDAKRIITRSI